jgi:hypothetical protein
MTNESDLLLEELSKSIGPVVTGARATVNHLKEWTDGFPASTCGAAPSGPSGVGPVPDETDDPDFVPEPARPRVDRAALKIQMIFELVDLLTVELADLAELVPGDRIVSPIPRLEARLEFIACQAKRMLAAKGLVSYPLDQLRRAAGRADHLSRLVSVNAPARAASGLPAGGCACHARAGEWAEIDDRYRKHQLCRQCGDFKHLFRQLPPPKLVRWAEKHGWRSAKTPANLARFNVKAAPRRPGA